MLKRSPRFAVAADGTVTIRRRPLVAAFHGLGYVIEWLDCVLDKIPAYEFDGERRRWERDGCWGCRLRLSVVWVPLIFAGDE